MKWTTVAESGFAWERDALEFLRARLPDHEPYRAWSNFEFIAEDGSVNEVDLLVFSPMGFFLIEIKSRPGSLRGDAGTWIWNTEGRIVTTDNPLILTNTKAKKLRGLLQRQRAAKGKGEIPYIEPLVFCSAPDLKIELEGTAALRVRPRDRETTPDAPERPGIVAAITRRECPGLDPRPKGTLDRPTARIVSQAMEQAGVRPSRRSRKVSDYLLERVIGEGPGYQDWLAIHARLDDARRRARLYHVRGESSKEDREKIERAALREFQILETLQHPGVLRVYGFSEHELGPALIFEHDPLEIRLDHYLAQNREKLGVDVRLDLVRRIAEAVQFAHAKKVVHRGLSPQSILVTGASSGTPRVKLFNWQLGYRLGGSTSGMARSITATAHVDRFVDDSSRAYMAPEAVGDDGSLGEHLDVFSLGALAHHIFSGEPPAANAFELNKKLRDTKGLQISDVMNGAGNALQDLIRFATHPEVPSRIDSAEDFLEHLDLVVDELTTPEHQYVTDPRLARRDDVLPGDLTVLKRVGQGGSSVALLVERGGREFILKAASEPEYSDRIREEAAVLEKLRHSYIVDVVETVEIGEHAGFLMRPVYANKSDRRIETLGQRLRKEGRLQFELLQRFGDDLLTVLAFLEEQGVPHRDIKPDNIAVGGVGHVETLHAVLFDFSLARAPVDNIRAGTHGYLDPLLPLRKPPRWDLHAERYAAAVTLYELSTGALPRWGDGVTPADQLDCEATIDADLFDPNLREPLGAFFTRALRRDVSRRFDNAEHMLEAWRQCFAQVDQAGAFTDHEDEEALRAALATATLDTAIHELDLGTRATNALDRANILTVEELLTIPNRRLLRLRGVGSKTRREISSARKILNERLGDQIRTVQTSNLADDEKTAEPADVAALGVDQLANRLFPKTKRAGEDKATPIARALIGFDPIQDPTQDADERWPSQGEVAEAFGVTRQYVSQIVGKFLERWRRDAALTSLRGQVSEILAGAGGAMSVLELVEAVIQARGSVLDEPQRSAIARGVVRAVVETERSAGDPRFQVRRDKGRFLVVAGPEAAAIAFALGDLADRIAAEDPLATPQRVVQRLREAALGALEDVSDARLVRLAVAASTTAALSSRQELYPRGMEAARALKLSQGALYGVSPLTVDELRERVQSRYPDSEPLPDPPALESLLHEAGIDLRWDPTAGDAGGFVARWRDSSSVHTTSRAPSRRPTASNTYAEIAVTPEIADARQFEERLRRGLKEGSFHALVVRPSEYQRAHQELSKRFPVELVDFEGLFLDALRAAADKARVNWDLVVATDARPREGDWDKLQILVGRALADVEKTLSQADRPLLLIHVGPLARYDRMDLLERLRDRAGRRDGIPGLWVLIPGDYTAAIDGKAVPLVGPGQRARVPDAWITNDHRGKEKGRKDARA